MDCSIDAVWNGIENGTETGQKQKEWNPIGGQQFIEFYYLLYCKSLKRMEAPYEAQWI